MNTKLIGISIAAVIGIIVLGSVLMPILDDATVTQDTLDNTKDALGMIDKIDATTDTYKLEFTHGSSTVTINETDTVDLFAGTVVCQSDRFIVRYLSNGFLQLYTSSGSWANVGDANSVDTLIEIASGTATITPSTSGTPGTVRTVTDLTECYVLAKTGNYVMKAPTQDAYVLEDSQIIAMGLTNNVGISIKGTVESVTISNFYPANQSHTFSNVIIDATEDGDHVDTYTINKITFDGEYDGTTTSYTYNYFIVPAEITAEKTVHFTDGQNAILGAIPIMIIVAILLGVVALVVRSRLE